MPRKRHASSLSLPAIRGKQGRYAYYTCTISLRDLLRVLAPIDKSIAPEMSAQRPLNEKRAYSLSEYIGKNENYTLPPITASADKVSFASSRKGSAVGTVTIKIDGKLLFLCNDGQHRRRAIEIALEVYPHIATDTVSLVLYEDSNLPSMQQRFADLNSAQPAARSVKLLYDLRRPSKARTAVLKKPFRGLVEMQAANALPQSEKLWTLSGLDKTPNIDKTAFWTTLLDALPGFDDLLAGRITAKDTRKKFIWAHNVALQGIGYFADKVSADKLVAAIDWERSNPEWENRAQRGSKMLATRRNAVLITNLLLQKLGLPLPPQLIRIENTYLTEQAVANANANGNVLKPAVTLYQPPAPALIRSTSKLNLDEWARFFATGPFAFGDAPSFAGISGGRTSAMMAALLDPRVKLCFENTSREHSKTYEFLLRVADALQREIVWLEWRPPLRKGAPPSEFGFAIVDEKTCTRNGDLFDGLLQALKDFRATKGEGPVVPYFSMRICTAYLKHRVQRAYMQSLGIGINDDQIQYIGLRYDEPTRIADLRSAETSARHYLTPLADAQIAKLNVNTFWRTQSFDLELEHDRQGNCGGCFLKADADLSRVLGEAETDAAWWIDIQRRYPGFGGKNKYSYEQLLKERSVRLAIEAALRDGKDPASCDDGTLTPNRFKLVVLNEKQYLAEESKSFACACESSIVFADKLDDAA